MASIFNKQTQALNDMQELHDDVLAGFHIPIKYRKMDLKRFMEVERFKYAKYLEREITNFKNMMAANSRRH